MIKILLLFSFTFILQGCDKEGEAWEASKLINPFTDKVTFVALTNDNNRRIYCDIELNKNNKVIFNIYLLIKSPPFPKPTLIDIRFDKFKSIKAMSYYDATNNYGLISIADMQNFGHLFFSKKVTYKFPGQQVKTFNLEGSESSVVSSCKSEASLHGINLKISNNDNR